MRIGAPVGFKNKKYLISFQKEFGFLPRHNWKGVPSVESYHECVEQLGEQWLNFLIQINKTKNVDDLGSFFTVYNKTFNMQGLAEAVIGNINTTYYRTCHIVNKTLNDRKEFLSIPHICFVSNMAFANYGSYFYTFDTSIFYSIMRIARSIAHDVANREPAAFTTMFINDLRPVDKYE